MATIAKQQVEVKGFWGKPNLTPEIRQGPIAATQTWLKGTFIKWASGLLSIASADDNDLVGISAIAQTTPASGTLVPYYPFSSDLLLEFTLLEGSAADHTSVVGDRGAVYGWQISTNTYLDTSETTNGLFRVVAIPGTDYAITGKGIVGDVNVRVLAVPINATVQF